jgi:hypothetical protein
MLLVNVMRGGPGLGTINQARLTISKPLKVAVMVITS